MNPGPVRALGVAATLVVAMSVLGQPVEQEIPMECERVHDTTGVALDGLRQTFDRWAAAVEEGDLTTLAALMTGDAEFWTHGQAPLVGRDAAIEAFAGMFRRYDADQSFECLELFTTVDWALARGIEHNRLVPKDGGDVVVVRQRAFTLLRHGADGVWRFARGMTNLPPQDSSSRP